MNRLTKLSAVVGVGVAAALGIALILFYLYPYPTPPLRPNIQLINTDIRTGGARYASEEIVYDQRNVLNSSLFDYTAEQKGSYELVFSNVFSPVHNKSVSVTYTVDGMEEHLKSLEIPALTNEIIPLEELGNQTTIRGSFNVTSGSAGADGIDFLILARICHQNVPFSFDLINTGTANGTATIKLLSDGREIWSDNYFVATDDEKHQENSVSLADCDQHRFSLLLAEQTK